MRNSIHPDILLECAVGAAREAGTHALRNLHRRGETLRRSDHDVKLKLDVECQEKALAAISARFPDHAILGEEDLDETPPDASGETLQWVVDPIDGTVNFSHGYPLWCCSVAVRRGEDVLAGAVYAPALDKLFTASIEDQSRCNGEPIHVSHVGSLGSALIFTGTNRVVPAGWKSGELFQRIAATAQRPRIDGAAALDVCRVACGQADGYIESGIYLWDVAAAGLIVRRAGGRAEKLYDLQGGALIFAASNGLIHAQLKALAG